MNGRSARSYPQICLTSPTVSSRGAKSRLIETPGRRCGLGRDGSEPGRSVERPGQAGSRTADPCGLADIQHDREGAQQKSGSVFCQATALTHVPALAGARSPVRQAGTPPAIVCLHALTWDPAGPRCVLFNTAGSSLRSGWRLKPVRSAPVAGGVGGRILVLGAGRVGRNRNCARRRCWPVSGSGGAVSDISPSWSGREQRRISRP